MFVMFPSLPSLAFKGAGAWLVLQLVLRGEFTHAWRGDSRCLFQLSSELGLHWESPAEVLGPCGMAPGL